MRGLWDAKAGTEKTDRLDDARVQSGGLALVTVTGEPADRDDQTY